MRHLRTCQEMVELGMELTREAHHQALADMHARPPGPAMPGSAAAEIERANARARLRGPNHAVIFTLLTRGVRQSLALQAHIAAGGPPLNPAAPNSTLQKRPERPPSPPHPDRPETFRGHVTERCDWALPTGPEGDIPVENLLQTIREDLARAAATSQPDGPVPKPLAKPRQPEPATKTTGTDHTWRPPNGRKFDG